VTIADHILVDARIVEAKRLLIEIFLNHIILQLENHIYCLKILIDVMVFEQSLGEFFEELLGLRNIFFFKQQFVKRVLVLFYFPYLLILLGVSTDSQKFDE
jgi:hypothetical protein